MGLNILRRGKSLPVRRGDQIRLAIAQPGKARWADVAVEVLLLEAFGYGRAARI